MFFRLMAVLFFGTSFLHAQEVRPQTNGPIHEAFLQAIQGTVIFQAIESKPPTPIQEKQPPQTDKSLQWIPGYWFYSPEKDEYIWVSGLWRRPPQGLQWIQGAWKQLPQGWIRTSGFWAPLNKKAWQYLEAPPPLPLQEQPTLPPHANSFWVPGSWVYDAEKSAYTWMNGGWLVYEPKWILVPASYIWREGGYLYLPPYWDHKIENRGILYSSVMIDASIRNQISYEPSVKVDLKALINTLFLAYPDYAHLLSYDYRYHPEDWSNVEGVPPWWKSPTWWTLSWPNQWILWWWYTHSGYSQPAWMTREIANKLPPPSAAILDKMRFIESPLILAPQGVVTPQSLYEAAKTLTGKAEPLSKDNPIVLPASTKLVESIKEVAGAKLGSNTYDLIRPAGKTVEILPFPKISISEADKKILEEAKDLPIPPTPDGRAEVFEKGEVPKEEKPAEPAAPSKEEKPSEEPAKEPASDGSHPYDLNPFHRS